MIIGIVGKAGSGKDTIAGVLAKDYQYFPLSFAEPLKIFCQKVLGFTSEQLWGPSEKRLEPHHSGQKVRVCVNCGWFGQQVRESLLVSDGLCPHCEIAGPLEVPLTARLALQTLGTDWGRAVKLDIWAQAGVSLATEILAGRGAAEGVANLTAHKPEGIVFSDVRFLNEAEAIREAGGVIWRVTRPGIADSGGVANHPSEVEQDKINPDLIIANVGTLADLVLMVLDAWEKSCS